MKFPFEKERLPQYDSPSITECVRRQREWVRPFCGYEKILTVGPTTGQETIFHSEGIVDIVHADFFNFQFLLPSNRPNKTPKRFVLGKQEQNGTLNQVFGAIRNIQERIMDEGQVLSFFVKFPNAIREGKTTYFPACKGEEAPAKDMNNVFLIGATRENGKLAVRPFSWSDDAIRPADATHVVALYR